jgi:hypothetical protein
MISIEKIGRRHYLRNTPYSVKDTLFNAGCKWDSQEKSWWTGKRELAESLLATLSATTEDSPTPVPPVGVVTYAKLSDGTWGVRGPVEMLVFGEVVEVIKRSGETKRETVAGRISEAFGVATARIVQRDRAPRPKSARQSHYVGVESCGGPCPVTGRRCTRRDPCHDCL